MFFVQLETLHLDKNRVNFLILICNLILLILFNIISISEYVCYCQDNQQNFNYDAESLSTIAVLTQEDIDSFPENLELIQNSLTREELGEVMRFKNLVETYRSETEPSYQHFSNNLDEQFADLLKPGLLQQKTNSEMLDISRKLENNNNTLLSNYSYFKCNIINPWVNLPNKDIHFLCGSIVGIEFDGLINNCKDCQTTIQNIQAFARQNVSIGIFFLENPGIESSLESMNNSFSYLSQDIDTVIDEGEIQVYIPKINPNGSITYTPKAIADF
jgi:hypothetical protein